MIRWRALLEHLRVPWGQRNTGRGWISIRCPFCGTADRSQNLVINEQSGGYRCFLVDRHSGRSPYWLLSGLGVPAEDVERLIVEFGGRAGRMEPEPKVVRLPSAYSARWDTFTPASQYPMACEYLRARGFASPIRLTSRYDLRVGRGQWGGRLWFPLRDWTDEGALNGYTGRALTAIEPRYRTEATHQGLYMPRPPATTEGALLLVEGPMDALRLADTLDERPEFGICPAALCGMSLGPVKQLQLYRLGKYLAEFCVALDNPVSPVTTNRLIREIMGRVPVYRLTLPADFKDPAEMTGREIIDWLRGSHQWEVPNQSG